MLSIHNKRKTTSTTSRMDPASFRVPSILYTGMGRLRVLVVILFRSTKLYLTLPHGSSWSPPAVPISSMESTSSPQSVHLQSFSSLLHFQSTPHRVHMESRWSGLEVDFGLSQIQRVTGWSPGGLHVESWWTGPCGVLVESIRTQGMFHKMHLQGIEHTISCIECLCKQQLPLPLGHRVLKYLTNGFYICNISSNSVICILKEFSMGNVCLSIS